MELENHCLIPANREATWDLIMDLPRAAHAVPGLQNLTPEGADRYVGTIQVRVGPIRLNLAGSVQMLQQDRAKGEATLLVEASDRRVGGAVRTNLRILLIPQSEHQTELAIYSDTTFMGKLGELGQPIIRRKASATIEEFASNLTRLINTG
jgi:carbon monoxide dehydrogenase subunit G